MRIVKNTIFALVGIFGAMESFSALAGADSAMHQIYGGTMLIVATLCVGFSGRGKDETD